VVEVLRPEGEVVVALYVQSEGIGGSVGCFVRRRRVPGGSGQLEGGG